MKLHTLVSMILLFAVVCCGPASGQTIYTPEFLEWDGGAFGGTSFAGDHQFLTQVSVTSQEGSRNVGVHYASGYQIGARINQNLRDFWAASLEYSFANQPLRFTNLSPSIQSLSLGQSVQHFSYDISYLPLSPRTRFRPYGKFGAGAALFYISSDSKNEARALGVNLRDSWEFAFNWGGEFKYLVDDDAALTFDFKDQITDMPSYGLLQTARVVDGVFLPGFSSNGLIHSWQINIGFAVQWDD